LSRTPLTYYGGKQALSRQIVPLMPSHRLYLEPFAGGAAVLFAKPRAERETLNDLDGTIMRFWRVLRDRPDDLAEAVAATPYGNNQSPPSEGAAVRPSLESLATGASTPERSSDGKKSPAPLLNPCFVEWMLGLPEGWSDPDCPLSATEFRSRLASFSAGASSTSGAS
jgi:hypothetical protein